MEGSFESGRKIQMVETRLYVGLNDAETKKQIFETEKYLQQLKEICFTYHVPFSVGIEEGGYFHDNGDYVVVINADKVVLSGNKSDTKAYYRHSGYPGGLRRESFKDMLERKPTFPLEAAVKGMLPRGPLGRKVFLNMKVYAGDAHPHAAQNPIIYEF
jgi:hypothetical protein